MPSHLARRVAWGLTWRWLLLLVSLITPAPPAAIAVIAVLLAAGLVAVVWRRRDLLGSAWRVLLAVTIINVGFWVGGAALVPAITLAVFTTLVDLWWTIAGRVLEDAPERTADDLQPSVPPAAHVSVVEPYRPIALFEPVAYATRDPAAGPVPQARRRRASRSTSGGLRLLVAACVLVLVLSFGAFTAASRAAAALSAAVSSFSQQVAPITAAVPGATSAPSVSPAPTPAPTPTPAGASPLIVPNGGDAQQPAVPRIDTRGLCLSLPDGRYELRLPDGQVVVVTTRHRAGCPDLSAVLKALQNAADDK